MGITTSAAARSLSPAPKLLVALALGAGSLGALFVGTG